MERARVFITRLIPAEGIERMRTVAELEIWQDELPPPYPILLEKVSQIDGLVCLLTDKIDATLMDAAGPNLKVISQYAVGHDNIDVRAATERRIPVGNTPGVLTEATADLTWALLLSAARRIVEGDRYTRQGCWKTWGPTLLLGADLSGATLGIVGLGRIGTAVARRARGFDLRILYYDVTRQQEFEQDLGLEYAPFDELLHQADFITVHTWLSPETYHLFGEAEFKKMKQTAVFVNAARGGIVDHQALYTALKNGHIAYAALDVTEPEPILPDSPLLQLDNVIIVPHIASASVRTRTRMAMMAAENLIAGLNGQVLPHCVNPEVYGNL